MQLATDNSEIVSKPDESRTPNRSSRFGAIYNSIYDAVCGRPPYLRPWHFQWLQAAYLYHDLERVLSRVEGRVLDVGCGTKPYRSWLRGAIEFTGIDIYAGPDVDHVIVPGEPWPIESGSKDVVLCTQVLEHVSDLDNVLREIHRTLAPGGRAIVTAPFAYNVHGVPYDFRRFTTFGLRLLFEDRYEIEEVKGQGGVGSTIGSFALNWWANTTSLGTAGHVAKAITLPLWIPFCGAVNLICRLLDKVDRTDCFYGNVMLVARKRS